MKWKRAMPSLFLLLVCWYTINNVLHRVLNNRKGLEYQEDQKPLQNSAQTPSRDNDLALVYVFLKSTHGVTEVSPKDYQYWLFIYSREQTISGSNSEYLAFEKKRPWEGLQYGGMRVGFSERCGSDSHKLCDSWQTSDSPSVWPLTNPSSFPEAHKCSSSDQEREWSNPSKA